jgi:hypothetical protein
MLDIWGADAYDDRPIHLARGVQTAPAAGEPLTFTLDLLAPAAPWLSQAATPADGRYIAYLKDAARPNAPGLPVATFSIRGGALVAPQPVPLPLTRFP